MTDYWAAVEDARETLRAVRDSPAPRALAVRAAAAVDALEGGPPRLTVRQAAARLAVSEATVRRRIADGSLPAVRIGRTVRVPAEGIYGLS